MGPGAVGGLELAQGAQVAHQDLNSMPGVLRAHGPTDHACKSNPVYLTG